MNNPKKKKLIFAIIALVLFLVCVCGNFYTVDSYAVRTYFTRTQNISAQLFSGDMIEQEFVLADGDQGVQVLLGTYLTVLEKGTIQAELFDEQGEKIAETTADLTGMTDNKYANFYFGDLDEHFYGQILRIRFTFSNIDNQLIAIFDSETDWDKYVYTVNGELRDANLSMNGIKKTTYVEYRDFRLFYVFGIGAFAAYVALFKMQKKTLHNIVKQAKAFERQNWKHMLIMLGLFLGSTILATLYTYVESAGISNAYWLYARIICVFILAVIAYFRKHLIDYAHSIFFVLCVLVGSIYIVSAPAIALGWDEQQHYATTSYMSWGASGNISEADYMIYSRYNESHYENVYEREQRAEWIQEINTVDAQGGMREFLQSVNLGSVAYIIPSIVLYATRIIGLDFVTRFTIGRFVNLVLYAFFMATAIKMLKGRGKILIASVGLIPTNLFLACSYSYDWWVNSLLIMGFSVFVGELQSKGAVSVKKQIQAVSIMCLGMLPKAVYFPLLVPLMLMKKDRYEDAKKCRTIVVIGILALMLSFVLPFLVSAGSGAVAGGGDIRGGSQVNAVGQINYILTNPYEFFNIMKNFIRKYLNPDQSMKYLTEMSSYERGEYHSICLILLSIAAVMDNCKKTVFKKIASLASWGTYICSFGTIIIVALALYIAYTPVGDTWIDGCQLRYILPVLFPFLFVAGENSFDVEDSMKRKVFVWCLIGMSAVAVRTFLYSFIRYY